MTLQIFNRGFQHFNAVFKCPQGGIALHTEQPAYLPGSMVVVDSKRLFGGRRLATNTTKTVLLFAHVVVLFFADPKLSHQVVSFLSTLLKFSNCFSIVRAFFAICMQSVGAILRAMEGERWFYLPAFWAVSFSGGMRSLLALFELLCNRQLAARRLSIVLVVPTATLPTIAPVSLKFGKGLIDFAFPTDFGQWYGEFSHVVRISITNSVIRLGQKFAALVRAASILPRISRNHNNLWLCTRAPLAAADVLQSASRRREAFLCL